MTGFLDALKEARKAAVFEKVGVDEPTSKSDEGDAVGEQISPMSGSYLPPLHASLVDQQKMLSDALNTATRNARAIAASTRSAALHHKALEQIFGDRKHIRPAVSLASRSFIVDALISEQSELESPYKLYPRKFSPFNVQGYAIPFVSRSKCFDLNQGNLEKIQSMAQELANSILAEKKCDFTSRADGKNIDGAERSKSSFILYSDITERSAEPVRPINIDLSEDPEASARLIRASVRRVIKDHRDEIEALAYK